MVEVRTQVGNQVREECREMVEVLRVVNMQPVGTSFAIH